MEVINDCHVHLTPLFPSKDVLDRPGRMAQKKALALETPKNILKSMDKNKVDKIVALSGTTIDEIDIVRQETDHLHKIAKQGKKRIYPFIRINPIMPGAADEIKRAIQDLKFTGVKMLPNQWYPYEDRVQEIYKVINDLKVPVLFHSGILWGHGDSSRFCRPAYYECMIKYPNVKFALAHVGWPWTDECLAVAGRFNHGDLTNKKQMFIDITTGAPRIWKTDVMRKALSYIPHEQMMYGSDIHPWDEGYRDWVRTDFEILAECGADSKTVRKIMYENFKAFVK